MPRVTDPRPQRAVRLAAGVAAATAISYGMALPVPFFAPTLALLLLATRVEPLPLSAVVGLPLVVILTTSAGLLLIPLLDHALVSGVLLVGLGLFGCFVYQLRGGNPLLATFVVIGLTLISGAGATSFGLALVMIEAVAKGLLLAVLVAIAGHWLFPDAPGVRHVPPPGDAGIDVNWVALRATLVVMPPFLMVLINPATYIPLIMKSVALGQQACATRAQDAGREILGSTLLGGVLAVAFWGVLTLFPHLWMFFLWTLLAGLWLARKLYALSPTRLSPSFWLNTFTTMIILLGQSVQDSAAGKDVYTAFAVRMSLFVAVTLYACGVIYLIDARRGRRASQRAST